mmetsp:Transcript_150949/g.267113  ORF Transcript_150949/g.267113 Transcript_150949/m.267113 type:complete len:144 (-) Transcript_150949:1197-1628(-)
MADTNQQCPPNMARQSETSSCGTFSVPYCHGSPRHPGRCWCVFRRLDRVAAPATQKEELQCRCLQIHLTDGPEPISADHAHMGIPGPQQARRAACRRAPPSFSRTDSNVGAAAGSQSNAPGGRVSQTCLGRVARASAGQRSPS